MNPASAALHRNTPVLQTVDPRGLPIRSIALCRISAADEPEVRINRSAFDRAGRVVARWDPRLWADQAPANLTSIYSLSGQVLGSDSVDAGWRLSLFGEGGQTVEGWDGRGTVRQVEYDELLRPTAVFEDDECVEQLIYGGADLALHNQCGQLIHHDDPAGTRLNSEFALTGEVIEQMQQFQDDRYTSHWRFNPLGEAIGQTDALGNVQRFAHTVAGQLKATHVQLNDQVEQRLISDIRYDAQGRVESETAGNGVVSSALYREEDGRLLELKATRNGDETIQQLIYDYDPVGNVIRIEDRVQPTRHFANQRIDPVSTYQYDTLYQLIEATGREAIDQGPELANYTQTYRYDAGGNLQQLTHVGAQNHSQRFVTARTSNRTLLVVNDQPPDEEDIAAAFDANGNLLELQAGQVLTWDRRNQLQQVRPVVREAGNDDNERYIYDASGQRMRKIRTTEAKTVTHTAEVRYLPGLEIRTDTATAETLHVICPQAGRSAVRVLHWQSGKREASDNDQVRYALADHLGSSTLELDKEAQIISQESYYPFGGTACWAARNAIEASYKTVRYSGKERDATGLYYYGLRYYAPWLQRWINPDPAGAVDGLNIFCFVRNSPLRYGDREGAAPYDVPLTVTVVEGLSNFNDRQTDRMKDALDVATRLLKRTSKELAKTRPGKDVLKAFKATFGALEPEQKSETIMALKVTLDEQREFLETFYTPQAEWDINLINGPESISGQTRLFMRDGFAEDVGMLEISEIHLENDHILSVATTLIHESSHAVDKTADIYYYAGTHLSPETAAEQIEAWSKGIRRDLKQVGREGFNERKVDFANYQDAVKALREGLGSEESRTRAFMDDPNFRVSLLRMNADTFSSFVMASKLPAKLMQQRAARSPTH